MMDMAQDRFIDQAGKLRHYYRFQSRIYDLTRWSFLFGRKELLTRLPVTGRSDEHIVEVGCGTGHNLMRLHKLRPGALITGLDVSHDMVARAREKTLDIGSIRTLEEAYGPSGQSFPGQIDGIVLSYALTMMNPGWEDVLDQAHRDLRPGGWIAVVDFHDSRHEAFKDHMSGHHVRMDGHLLPFLQRKFSAHYQQVRSAYGGLWSYFSYVGIKY